jgi:protein subunit release factor A
MMEALVTQVPKSKKDLLFSLTAKDFKVEYFTASVKAGGSGKDTSNTACRITHIESGAVGMSRDERSQAQNRKKALERLVATKEFQRWQKIKAASVLQGYREIEKMIEDQVDKAMDPKNLKIEEHTDDGWMEIK